MPNPQSWGKIRKLEKGEERLRDIASEIYIERQWVLLVVPNHHTIKQIRDGLESHKDRRSRWILLVILYANKKKSFVTH